MTAVEEANDVAEGWGPGIDPSTWVMPSRSRPDAAVAAAAAVSTEAERAAVLAAQLAEDAAKSAQQAQERDQAYDAAARFDAWRSERILTLDQLRSMPKPEPLLGENILFTGTNAWLLGAPGCYKSFVALAWSCCIATGTPWLSHRASLRKVLYISLEATSGLTDRVDAWAEHTPSADRALLDANLTVIKELNLSEDFDRAMFLEAVQVARYGLVVIDTQARAVVGVNENDKHEMDPFISLLTKAAQTSGATTLTVHHSPKGDQNPFRGSGSIEGAADSAFWIKKTDNLRLDLNFYRQKDTESGHTWQYEMIEIGNSLSVTNPAPDGEGSTKYEEKRANSNKLQLEMIRHAREAGRTGMTRNEFAKALTEFAERIHASAGKSTIYGAVSDVIDSGCVEVVDGTDPEKRSARFGVSTSGKLRLAAVRAFGDEDENDDSE